MRGLSLGPPTRREPDVQDSLLDSASTRLEIPVQKSWRVGNCTTLSVQNLTPTTGRQRRAKMKSNFWQLFLSFPQGSLNVHRFRTALALIPVAGRNEMRESSLTASVNVALPVIVRGGSAASERHQLPVDPEGSAGERSE
jgi:hypothetical protein